MSKLIYLAGAMNHFRSSDYKQATRWRKQFRDKIVCCNDNYYTNFKVFDPTLFENKYHDVVTQNLYYLDKADVLVLNLDSLEHSLGSLYELAYFSYNGKPIITIGNHKWLNHPYMKKFISMQLNNVDEVVDFLKDMYGQ